MTIMTIISLKTHYNTIMTHRFESLNLPFIPADRSDFDVHGALLDDKVHYTHNYIA